MSCTLEALASAAAFLRNEAIRRPVAPQTARDGTARIPNSLRQKWLADAVALRALKDALEKWPGTASQITHKVAFSDSLALVLEADGPTGGEESERG